MSERIGYFVSGYCTECECSHEFGPYRSFEEMDDDYKERLRSHTMEEYDWDRPLGKDETYYIPKHVRLRLVPK